MFCEVTCQVLRVRLALPTGCYAKNINVLADGYH